MTKYTITADPRVADDLIEARDFLNSRRKGYGKKLLIELAKIAKNRNCGRLEWSVLDWNTPAIDFYKSLSAKPMDEWTVFRLTEKEIAELSNKN